MTRLVPWTNGNQRLLRPLTAVILVVIIVGAILDSIVLGWGGAIALWVLVGLMMLVMYGSTGWPGAAVVHRRFTLPFVMFILRPFGARAEPPPPPLLPPRPPPPPPPPSAPA